MQISDLKKLERIRVLRRDRYAARLSQLRSDFEPIDGKLGQQEAELHENHNETKRINTRIANASNTVVFEIQNDLDSIERQLERKKFIEQTINEVHKERLNLLGSIRSARNDWRNAGRACDRWSELLSISAEVTDYNERVAEENSSSEAVFYIKNNRT